MCWQVGGSKQILNKKSMKIKWISLVFTLLICTQIFSQKNEVDIKINILAHDKIAEVNLDNDNFVNSFSKIVEYCKKNFSNFPVTQKIVVLTIFHKSGNPTYNIYSNPQVEEQFIENIKKEIAEIKIENTKYVDFPIVISLNCSDKEDFTKFNGFINPITQKIEDYENADLVTKIRLNKEYVINEVLPVLSAYQIKVEEKFVGVINFGKLIRQTNFYNIQNIENLTSRNKDYWRAVIEMGAENQLIPVTKIAALMAQGEFDYAKKYLEVINTFSDPKNITETYLQEIRLRLNLFNTLLEKEIQKGISLHDKGEYKKALEIYDGILKIYPNSSWALYEKYYSTNAKSIADGISEMDGREIWDASKAEIYKHNPLYNMDVRASNGKEAYLLFRRQEVESLFKKKDEKLNDLFKYAQISSDLSVYDFAAQLFWISASFDENNSEKAIHNFLYCIDKLGEKKLKENFKGDFEKLFKEIEVEKEKTMKKNIFYKSMKN